MLKITYEEERLIMEWLAQPLEDWVNSRMIVTLESGISFSLTQEKVSFPVPSHINLLRELESVISDLPYGTVQIHQADLDSLEIVLQGQWAGINIHKDEQVNGVFICSFNKEIDWLLWQIWQMACGCFLISKD